MHLLEFDEAKLGSKFTEAFPRQCLRQDICQLIRGANRGNTHPAFLDALTNKMVSYIYVFTTIMEDMILTQLDGGLTVDVEFRRAFPLALQFGWEAREPYTLADSSSPCDVLNLA